jgi:membrane dipeptidase
MAITRRDFIATSGASLVASGVAGSVAGGGAEPVERPVMAPADLDSAFANWIVIDALSGTDVDETDLDAWKRSGTTMLSMTMGPSGDPPFGYDQAVEDIATWHGNFAKHRDKFIHVLDTSDILRAKREGKHAVMLNFQNATHLKRDIKNVQFFYDLGIRQMLLTYNSLNSLGAGCTERKDVGLSDFGVEVVAKMNELGMLVDTAHCGVMTTLDAIEVSKKPVLITHSNCRALSKNDRCKPDEVISKCAEKGGVIGISTVNFFVSQKPRSTVDDYIAHIEHVVKLVGIDHVGIGSDSPINAWRKSFPDEEAFWKFHRQFHYKPGADVRWPPFIEELDVPEKLKIISQCLSARGFSNADIEKIMGLNFLRVYKEILG